jgi:hypothetical protein
VVVSSVVDDEVWIGPRIHSLKYRIERWHRMKIEQVECWRESPVTFWIRTARGRWILVHEQRSNEFQAEIVFGAPR